VLGGLHTEENTFCRRYTGVLGGTLLALSWREYAGAIVRRASAAGAGATTWVRGVGAWHRG